MVDQDDPKWTQMTENAHYWNKGGRKYGRKDELKGGKRRKGNEDAMNDRRPRTEEKKKGLKRKEIKERGRFDGEGMRGNSEDL